MPVDCRATPEGVLQQSLGDRANPYAGLSVEVSTALPGPSCGADRETVPGTPTWAPGCWARRWPRPAANPEQLLQERICLPLGMPDTLVVSSGEQAARMAVGHTRRGRPVPRFEDPALPGAGALRSTATDMLRFLEANLDPAPTPLAAQIEHIQRPRHRGQGDAGGAWLADRPARPSPAGPLL